MKTNSIGIIFAVVLAFFGALVSLGASSMFFVDQAAVQGSRIWPLPALILIDWGLMGALGFFGVLLGRSSTSPAWLKVSWFVVGALVPYVVLGAFSIGPYVLISLVLILAGSILVTAAAKAKWLELLGFFLAGVVCNLGFYFILVAVGSILGFA